METIPDTTTYHYIVSGDLARFVSHSKCMSAMSLEYPAGNTVRVEINSPKGPLSHKEKDSVVQAGHVRSPFLFYMHRRPWNVSDSSGILRHVFR